MAWTRSLIIRLSVDLLEGCNRLGRGEGNIRLPVLRNRLRKHRPVNGRLTWEWLVTGKALPYLRSAQESRQVLQYLSLSLGSPDGLEVDIGTYQ